MAVLETGDLTIPNQYFTPWLKKVQESSVISQLSGSIPMKFGKGETVIFDSGEAEYVGEGQNKSSSDLTSKVQSFEPFKFQKTIRVTNEFEWANEDHQLGVLQEILDTIQPALTRALDFGVIHGIDPHEGTRPSAMEGKALVDATNSVELDPALQPWEILEAADAPLLEAGQIPSGIAADPRFLKPFRTARTSEGVRLYPNVGFSGVSELDGHEVAISRTVSANGVAQQNNDLAAVVGDFSAVRWGVQKSIGLEYITYGDPDGNGDLKRNNQVAFRAEVVYGWGIADLDAFTLVKDPADAEGN